MENPFLRNQGHRICYESFKQKVTFVPIWRVNCSQIHWLQKTCFFFSEVGTNPKANGCFPSAFVKGKL